MTDRIVAEAADGIGWLTFNNPERRNAISLDMWQRMDTVLAAFDDDPAIRVVVMRGSGDRAFVSGADISQFEDRRKTAEQADSYTRASEAGRRRLETFGKPLLAMIRGYCFGGGVSIAAGADLRIAAEDAVFSVPAARLGLGYPFESVGKLVGLIGPAATKDLLFTARRLDAAEALRIGLVDRVVPVQGLDDAVRATARGIAENAPLTIRAVKFAVTQVLADPGERDMEGLSARLRACFDSADYAEGRSAFREKRKPVFTGR